VDLRVLKEKGYICQKRIAPLNIPLTTLSLERGKKNIYLTCRIWEKHPFICPEFSSAVTAAGVAFGLHCYKQLKRNRNTVKAVDPGVSW